MIFGSVCSGIEAASVAWESLGWKAAFFSEIEKFPSALLKAHYPDVPNYGDMTKFKEWPDVSINILCGGTPCQSFSIAGLRKGLDDARGNLMLTFGEIASRYRPRWVVWENVPGVLSSNGGQDFAAFLGLLSGGRVSVPRDGWGSGGIIPGYRNAYGLAYRVFDAQYFGVAQRRRRVFVVGYIGDWRPSAAVLFERESLCGNPPPRRKAGQEITPTIRSSPPNGGNWPADVTPTLNAAFGQKLGLENQHVNQGCPLFVPHSAQTLRSEGFDASEDGTGRQNLIPISWDEELNANVDLSGTLVKGGAGGRHSGVMAFSSKDSGGDALENISPTLRAMNHDKSHPNGGGQVAVAAGMAVRRLTPVECERLQGFPDNYTRINEKTADGPRYKALGNSWAVPNVRWIGRRIQMVDEIINERAKNDQRTE